MKTVTFASNHHRRYVTVCSKLTPNVLLLATSIYFLAYVPVFLLQLIQKIETRSHRTRDRTEATGAVSSLLE